MRNTSRERIPPFLDGGGELARLIAAFDWSRTSLGPLTAWSPTLKSTTALILRSPVPIVVLWGEDGIMLYNDAYSGFAGGRHPQLLGSKVREGWPEVADFNDNVMKVGLAGGTLAYKDQQLTLFRHGRPEPVWMNLDYSPVLDESGTPVGVIAIVVETTQQVIAGRLLQESEERFRALTSATFEVVYRMSPDWREMRLLEGRGFLSDLQNSIHWQDAYLFPDDQPAVRAAIDQAIRTKSVFQLEHRVRRVDGSEGWTLSRAIPVLGEDDEIIEWFGAASDVTERRRADVRREALLQLREEIDRQRDPMDLAFVACRLLGQTLGASRAGYGTLDAVTDSFTMGREWVGPCLQAVDGTLDLRTFGSYVENIKRGELVVVADVTRDPRTGIAAEVLIKLQCRAFLNVAVVENATTVAVFRVCHGSVRHWSDDDIALVREFAAQTRIAIERRRAEQALRQLAESLEQQVAQRTRERDRVWRNSQDMQVVFDRDGVVQAMNPAVTGVLGWAPEDMIGRSAFDFIHDDDQDSTHGALAHARQAVLPAFINRFRHKDGAFRWISWVAAPDENLIYASGRDISAEKETAGLLAESEEALRQAQKMEAVGQLTGGLAHDFNNLLTGISGSLELMQTRIAQGRVNELERYILAARGAAERAASLTHRLLAFSRRQTLAPKPVDMNRLIADMAELINRTMGPPVEVEVVAAGGLWLTLADPNQLESALLNLCINARDAMPDGGKLTIETGNRWLDVRAAQMRDLTPGQYVTLCVSDTGTGMPPEVAARAFDPFYTTKPIGMGTGLGLSMVYGFARQSGGQARIYTEQGKGTMVCLYLPRYVGDDAEAEAVPDALVPRSGRGETVLVVDDEPTIRGLVLETLEDLGYQALEAADGAAALKVLCSDARIDLLVTDVGLPGGLNGRQLSDAARGVRPKLPVLFITGYAENAVLSHGHLAPGMHVMTKPFSMDLLASRIREILSER